MKWNFSWLHKLLHTQKKLNAKEIVEVKKIYWWKTKTQETIYEILELEVQRLLKKHPNYKVKKYSKPMYSWDGSMYYLITLKKK